MRESTLPKGFTPSLTQVSVCSLILGKTHNWVSLLIAQCFYPVELFPLEPHSTGFQGTW
jgi:hypothetical protein